ncbi:Aerobic cobaltochelatase subunit CobT [Candidatus Bealeia paramacronuclearis]|uniref:Aerobic cobaltochelatase subunit CobT n=1 Tax=Candidatus Bealeia paramacronuclearis TaxID=1921001 RepID=A0ABZ2C447_9PROT|nr:Aerobic cobaltochelatase subunit CobT [Candidatus Bealeia paramacronuclearis]
MELKPPSSDQLQATARALSQDPGFDETSESLVSRGQADFEGFWHGYHDDSLDRSYLKSALYPYLTICEEERCLSLGAKRYLGAFHNLKDFRPSLLEQDLRTEIREALLNSKKESDFFLLQNHLENQKEFAEEALKILRMRFPEVETKSESTAGKNKDLEISEDEFVLQDSEAESSGIEDDASFSQKATSSEGREVQEKNAAESSKSSISSTHHVHAYYARHYQVFINAFDKVLHAQDLASGEESQKLWQTLSDALHAQDPSHKSFHDATVKLKHILESRTEIIRYLDQEEGILNTPRLARLLTSPLRPLVYFEEEIRPRLDTTITLLIDNSGSMRGRPILLASLAAYRLGMLLDKCFIPFEVLGFTTQEWKGGHSRHEWVEKGKPENPGRLNDLLHIVYKPSRLSWRKTHRNLSFMLKESLLKENIDGEALIWAYERLLTRPEKRKVLIVISDGAPVDDSTLSTNGMDFLDIHLRSVTKTIETQNKVELFAIGIGHEVNKFYTKSTVINSAEELGETLFQKVLDLLSGQYVPKRRSPASPRPGSI